MRGGGVSVRGSGTRGGGVRVRGRVGVIEEEEE